MGKTAGTTVHDVSKTCTGKKSPPSKNANTEVVTSCAVPPRPPTTSGVSARLVGKKAMTHEGRVDDGEAGSMPSTKSALPDVGIDSRSRDESQKDNNKSVPSEHHASAESLLKMLKRASAEAKSAVQRCEDRVAELEDAYIVRTWAHGNLMRGWDGYVRRVDRAPNTTLTSTAGTGAGTATGAPKQRKLRPSDRMFSITSSTSAIRLEGVSADAGVRKAGAVLKKKKKR